MNTFLHLLGIAGAGALGTLARHGINCGSATLLGPQYPWGTYFANLLGSLLFGFIAGLIAGGFVPAHWKVYLLTGFLGGFTTFSAFAFENQHFLSQGRWGYLTIHLVGQNVLGILAVLLGLYLSQWIVGRG